MFDLNTSEDVEILALATKFIADSDLGQLRQLVIEKKHVLKPSLLYNLLLTYLPAESDVVPELGSFLSGLETKFESFSSLDAKSGGPSVAQIEREGLRNIQHLRVAKIPTTECIDCDDLLSAYLIQWLHKLDLVSGISASAVRLLDDFIATRPNLLLWRDSYLLPFVKLQSIFYPGRAEDFSLQNLEKLHGTAGVRTLLQYAEDDGADANIGRDLQEVVAPWVRGASSTKRRRLNNNDAEDQTTSWDDVNAWIYTTGRKNLGLGAKAFLQWNGPMDELSEAEDHFKVRNDGPMTSYAQTGIALVLVSSHTGKEANVLLRQLLDRAASFTASIKADGSKSICPKLSDATRADLFENNLLLAQNPITFPSEEVFSFLEACLSAREILDSFKLPQQMSYIVETALFGSVEKQKQELQRILQQIPRLTGTDIDWPFTRQQLLILGGRASTEEGPASRAEGKYYLGHISTEYLETEFLDALLLAGQYSSVKDIYIGSENLHFGQEVVRQHVISAIFHAYDNASNGNRTRGGMKRAFETFKAFQPSFESNIEFMRIDHLIRATHSLSFYQLTLQHGVPFQPINIRVHHDSVSLLEVVLSQNSKAYTKLDDLIDIGRNLVQADLPNTTDNSYTSKSLEERLFDVEHRVTYLAIISALSYQDFDTAYSYITTRLSTSPLQASKSPFTDDTSWRAVYAAGRYRPSSSPKNLHDRITGLSKRMDLLSLALTLAPSPDPLSEILASWRRCEEELESLKFQAVEEERAVEGLTRGGGDIPGGFSEDRDLDAAETRRMMERRALGSTGPSYEEEAPMGLFDVAKGAASAFRKSAFPLRGTRGPNRIDQDSGRDSGTERDSMDESRTSGEFKRVRKRDMVSNMMTGGLVSGVSWVLGAPPSARKEDEI